MARKDKINMPSGGAGLTRYFEDYKSVIEIKPGYVIFFALLVILIVVLLQYLGPGLIKG